jgi:hypothetical protein
VARLKDEVMAETAVIEQELEQGRIDESTAVARGQALLDTYDQQKTIIMEQYRLPGATDAARIQYASLAEVLAW